jgi:GDPmannose 4,6-dehydratase
LFNHESPLRGIEFVTRKITDAVARIYHGKQDYFEMGNMDAKRDWGYAKEYVEGMWLMLQQNAPDNFILATNETHSVREWIEICFNLINKEIVWEGAGPNEIGKDKKTEKVLVKVNPKFFRPAEVEMLKGDYSKAKKVLGWEPKTKYRELAEIMLKSDIDRNS